jgi:hypothetical protein
VPWQQILVYIEAVVRVYNRYGRRDNLYKARIKILVKAEGQRFVDAVNASSGASSPTDGSAHLIPQAELDRVASFVPPPAACAAAAARAAAAPARLPRAGCSATCTAHRLPGYRAVTLSLKRAGLPPGDVTADADGRRRRSGRALQPRRTARHARPEPAAALGARGRAAARCGRPRASAGFATPNIGLLTDMIACPGGDFCALANARSIPMAAEITERFADLDELHDIGDIDLHISGCINSCGHHHSGHIGILGVDKDGSEWYQVTLGGSDGSTLSGAAVAGQGDRPVVRGRRGRRRDRGRDRHLPAQQRPPASASSTPCAASASSPSRPRQRRAPQHGPRGAAARREDPTHEIHRAHKDPWHTAGGEDGPPDPHHPPPAPAASTPVACRARATGPGMPVGIKLANDADVRRARADLPRFAWWCCSSRSGPTAAPTARPCCCARAALRRARCAPPARCWSTCCRCCAAPASTPWCCAPTSRVEAARTRAGLLPGHYQGDVRQRARCSPAAARAGAQGG